jgi:DHA2 family multidrug resistance protein
MTSTCLMGSFMTSEWIRNNFYWLQSIQIVAQPMVILGILMGVTTGLAPTDGPFASAMFNSLKTFSAAVATGLSSKGWALIASIFIRTCSWTTWAITRL